MLYMVSILEVVVMVLGIYSVFGYLHPKGHVRPLRDSRQNSFGPFQKEFLLPQGFEMPLRSDKAGGQRQGCLSRLFKILISY